MVILKYIFTFATVQYELYFLNIKPNLINRRSNRQMKEKRSYFLILVLYLIFLPKSLFGGNLHPDVVVAGGGASGVSAALQSARMGMRVLVIEESTWLGGMLTSAGVSAIDGNFNMPAGIFGEFRNRLAQHYGSLEALNTGWVSRVLFEPSVGNQVLNDMVTQEKNIEVWKESSIRRISKKQGEWNLKIKKQGKSVTVKTPMLIDATELGDVAAKCGVAYDVGMDSRHDTQEDIALEKGNNVVQDLTYVAILKDYKKDVTMRKPKGYDPSVFACCCINPLCISSNEPKRMWPADKMMSYGQLPNGKIMLNWPINGNDYYVNLVEMSDKQRRRALKKAKEHTLCFLYFIQHELGYRHIGLAGDEYPTEDLLPFIPYHRESRRIHGAVRFTLNHMVSPYNQVAPLYRTSIAVGDYPVDHHHMRYKESHTLPDIHFYPVPSFGLPLGTLIPQGVEGLIVAEKSISVSNIANGATRLQPVVVQIGQAAGALAALSLKKRTPLSDVSVRDVQDEILKAGGYLLPYLDVQQHDPRFIPYQHIGSTGILKGVGKNVDWKNETWLRADQPLKGQELEGMRDIFPRWKQTGAMLTDSVMTLGDALRVIQSVAESEGMPIKADWEPLLTKYHFKATDKAHVITRGEMAVLIDQMLDPFHWKEVDIQGNFIK